jgi:Ca2+-binding EF-hand superfamily protein
VELKSALKHDHFMINADEINAIVEEVDFHGTHHRINYSEFLAATIKVKDILTDNKLLAIFNQFDADMTGLVSPDNIVEAMHKLGHKITAEELREAMT